MPRSPTQASRGSLRPLEAVRHPRRKDGRDGSGGRPSEKDRALAASEAGIVP
jgi:hypothetical protein